MKEESDYRSRKDNRRGLGLIGEFTGKRFIDYTRGYVVGAFSGKRFSAPIYLPNPSRTNVQNMEARTA